MDRKQYITSPTAIKDRREIWNDACLAAKNHIKKGKEFQAQGDNIIENINKLNSNVESMIKMVQQGVTITEKGIDIERKAHDKLISLHEACPK